MPHLTIKGRPAALATLPLLLLACGGLAACGGSSPTTTTTANAASTTHAAAGATTSPSTTTSPGTTAPTAPAAGSTSSGPSGPSGTLRPSGPGAGRFAALDKCLQKNGVTLPQRPAGATGPGGLLGPGARQLPKGVTSAQYRAALKKCAPGFLPHGSGAFHGRRSFSSPAFRTALAKFGDCLREQGINLPAPNTSGKGPIFDTKGIDTSSPKFRQAEAKCRSTLLAGLRARPGAARPGAPGGAAAG